MAKQTLKDLADRRKKAEKKLLEKAERIRKEDGVVVICGPGVTPAQLLMILRANRGLKVTRVRL